MDLNGAMSLSAGTALSSYGCMHETEEKKHNMYGKRM